MIQEFAPHRVALDGATQLRNAIALLRVGQTVELRVFHKGTIRSCRSSGGTPVSQIDLLNLQAFETE